MPAFDTSPDDAKRRGQPQPADLEALQASIAASRRLLDGLRPLSGEALRVLQKSFDIDLTYTSNAIEGNTLTLRETAELIEHGLTVGGKPLRDHLEAVDHYAAVLWMRELAAQDTPIGTGTVRELHRRIVARSQSGIAGIYSTHARRIAGSRAVFPNPLKIAPLMDELGEWLGIRNAAGLSPRDCFEAHWRLVAIHPFADGNGRTARLLMNLLLLRGGYPPLAVRPQDRLEYLAALEHASLQQDLVPYQVFMHARLAETLREYVELLQESVQARAQMHGGQQPPGGDEVADGGSPAPALKG